MFKLQTLCPYCRVYVLLTNAEPQTYIRDILPKEIKNHWWYSLYFINDKKENVWLGICNNPKCKKLVMVENGKTIPNSRLEIEPEIPEKIQEFLLEAYKSLGIDNYASAVVQARKIIQAVCLDKGCANNKNLGSQIEWLHENNFINADLKNFALTIKNIGNDGAHPNLISPEKIDAETCIYISHQICILLYTIPKKVKNLSKLYNMEEKLK